MAVADQVIPHVPREAPAGLRRHVQNAAIARARRLRVGTLAVQDLGEHDRGLHVCRPDILNAVAHPPVYRVDETIRSASVHGRARVSSSRISA